MTGSIVNAGTTATSAALVAIRRKKTILHLGVHSVTPLNSPTATAVQSQTTIKMCPDHCWDPDSDNDEESEFGWNDPSSAPEPEEDNESLD